MSRKPVGILRFLGTNCDRDVWQAVEAMDLRPEWLWHEDRFNVERYSAFIVPGGFSYGDYLRCGALAAKATVMGSLAEAAKKGYPILGICNGFQILCETRLLPGALVRNESRKFIDKWVDVEPVGKSVWTADDKPLRLPIAHGEGRYFAEGDDLKKLEDSGQVWLRYKSNPNGSINDIAGVSSARGHIAALMPHPERAIHEWMGGADGRGILGTLMGAG
ncbi:MAG TPA: phosphoribosylformylglycinamidine synthase subunit PurQ [Bdellovibrionales bacterium]|nr:phosphoribosylformylglycinamidine synthase subunit PurQ [Bdellovibrionales bacterium]